MSTRQHPSPHPNRGRGLLPFAGLLLVAAVSACASCRGEADDEEGPTLPEPLQLEETEPNDRPDQAMRLSEDADVTATLSVTPSRPDEDWYQLDPGGAGPRVDLRVEPGPGTDVAFELYDTFRNRLVVVNSEGVGKAERMPNLLLTGRRFVRVISAKPGSGGAYTLHIRFTPAEQGEEEEPNDQPETANAIPADTPVIGLLGHAGDEDWYRFELRPPEGSVPGASAGIDDGTGWPQPEQGQGATEALQPPEDPSALEDTPLPDRPEGPVTGSLGSQQRGLQQPVDEAPRYGHESGSIIPPQPREDEPSALPRANAELERPSSRDRLWARLDAERRGEAWDDDLEERAQARSGAEPALPGSPGASPGPSASDDAEAARRPEGGPDARPSPAVPTHVEGTAPDAMDAAWRAATAALLGQALPSLPAPPPPAPSVAIRLTLTGIEDVAQEVRVLAEDQTVRFEATTRPGEGLQLRHIGVSPEDRFVYVVVRPAWTGKGKDARRAFSASIPYSLTLGLEEEGAHAELEPNDSPDQATPLTPQTYREGFLSHPDDVDYFVLDAPEPVLADFHVTGVTDVDLALLLVERTDTGTRTLISARNGDVNDPEQLNAVRCEGQCLVRVESAMKRVDGKLVKGYANPDVPYRITVSTTPDDGSHEREPNNTPATATPLTLGQPVRGTIHPVRDVDHYRLDLSDRIVKTPIRVHLSGLLKVDLALFLHRQEGDGGTTLVQSADGGRGDEGEQLNYSAEPGIWILEVRDARNRGANPQDRYQLVVHEGR